MTLAIDMVGTNLPSGTKTYNVNFCKYLGKKKLKNKIYIFITRNYLKYIKTNNPNIHFVIKSNYLSNILFRFFWMQLLLPFELKRLKIKKLYSPMNFGPLLLKFLNIKFILGLHSNLPWVFFEKMPGNFFKKFITKFIMEKSIIASDILIVCSVFAKKEIKNLLKIKKKKIYPIYLGVDKNYFNNSYNKYYLKKFNYKNYILSVLSCVKYHNIINLLKAFKLLKQKKFEKLRFILILQILDKEYFLKVKKFIKNNFKEEEIIILHNLENKYLINLYKKAKFYIFSSYCEVFGLTSLEAMSQKCPVLISNTSAIPEINQKAALYFNPDNIEEIKNLMNRLLTENNLKKRLIKNGNNHFKKFNWNDAVNKTIKILEI